MKAWISVALLLLAGCAEPAGPVRADLRPGEAPDDVWMLHTSGCGFCGGTASPWATTLVLGNDGGVLWFSFRPPSGMDDDTWDGVVLPPEAEPLRPQIEAAIELLAHDDVYWTRDGHVRIYEAATFQVEDGDWRTLRMRLQGVGAGLEDPPPITDYGCEDCSTPHVQVVSDGTVLGGPVMERGRNGPGSGNVPAGGAWDVIEESLRYLHEQAQATASDAEAD